MKKLILGIFAMSTLLFSCNTNSDNNADEVSPDSTLVIADEMNEEESELAFNGVVKGEYTLFGHEEVNADDAVSQEEMFETFRTIGAFGGAVKVSINEVCQKAGCWINFLKEDGTPVMVFFRDHFTIPIEESAGKEAILWGQLETDTLSVEFQRHLLDDAAEAGEEIAQSDYDAITEEKIDVSFDCVSILLK